MALGTQSQAEQNNRLRRCFQKALKETGACVLLSLLCFCHVSAIKWTFSPLLGGADSVLSGRGCVLNRDSAGSESSLPLIGADSPR